jgi:hypothetical protein
MIFATPNPNDGVIYRFSTTGASRAHLRDTRNTKKLNIIRQHCETRILPGSHLFLPFYNLFCTSGNLQRKQIVSYEGHLNNYRAILWFNKPTKAMWEGSTPSKAGTILTSVSSGASFFNSLQSRVEKPIINEIEMAGNRITGQEDGPKGTGDRGNGKSKSMIPLRQVLPPLSTIFLHNSVTNLSPEQLCMA